MLVAPLHNEGGTKVLNKVGLAVACFDGWI
jgi:hypothetical protein